MTTYHFRVLLSSWGIAIDLDGVIHGSNLPNALPVDHGISFLNSTTLNPVAVNAGIIDGIKLMRGQIREKHPVTTVEVTKLEFNPLDFQFDGLQYAVAEWIAEELGGQKPDYVVNYDPLKRKYIFQ